MIITITTIVITTSVIVTISSANTITSEESCQAAVVFGLGFWAQES